MIILLLVRARGTRKSSHRALCTWTQMVMDSFYVQVMRCSSWIFTLEIENSCLYIQRLTMWHYTEEELFRLAILLNGFTSNNATYSYGVEYTNPGQDGATSLSHVAFFRSLARCLCPCLNFCLWLSSVCCSTLGTKLYLPSAISFL